MQLTIDVLARSARAFQNLDYWGSIEFIKAIKRDFDDSGIADSSFMKVDKIFSLFFEYSILFIDEAD